jgi:hypothetical protein
MAVVESLTIEVVEELIGRPSVVSFKTHHRQA